jgi:hypothetical protein
MVPEPVEGNKMIKKQRGHKKMLKREKKTKKRAFKIKGN